MKAHRFITMAAILTLGFADIALGESHDQSTVSSETAAHAAIQGPSVGYGVSSSGLSTLVLVTGQ
jgi:hypothetical protein